MSKPPNSTILLEGGIGGDGKGDWLIGIDLLFFTVTNKFYGIKNIPLGIHLFHYSKVEASSVRYGVWFECVEGDIVVLRWDSNKEMFAVLKQDDGDGDVQLLDYSKALAELGDAYSYMTNFQTNEKDWKFWKDSLVNHVDLDVLERVLGEDTPLEVSTIMASRQENDILREVLRKGGATVSEKVGVLEEELAEGELCYTQIHFKLTQSGSVGADVTRDYLDKTWYVNEIFPDREYLLGEFQASFVHYVIFGNYCSMVQWLNMLKLMLMSSSFVLTSKSFSLNFLSIYYSQLMKLPREYLIGGDADEILIDLKTYVEIIENFMEFFKEWDSKLCCGKLKLQGMVKQKWDEIINLHKKLFDIDFSKITNSTTDDIFNKDDEEEGPIIVDYIHEGPQ